MNRGRAALMALITMVIAFGGLALVLVTKTTPVLGLDLQGGFAVTLAAPEATDEAVLEKAVEIMRRRIESLGNVQEPEIAVSGDRSITVQLPGVTDRERGLGTSITCGAARGAPQVRSQACCRPAEGTPTIYPLPGQDLSRSK